MVALPVLVSGLEAEMVRLGYKDSTMVWYHGAWRRLQPCELSRIYTVKITYTVGRYPVTRILDPQLSATETGFLPHTYNDQSLCLYDVGQWVEHMLLVDTIVPWAAEWLLHYEVWVATGEWLGDQDPGAQLPRRYYDLPAL